MRRLRIAIIVLFVLSGISFAGYNVVSRLAEDHTPPEISCDSDTVSVSVEDEDIDQELLEGVTAKDNKDGDLTDAVRVSSMSNFTEPGKRTITYAVFDKAGQAATLTRTLEYTDYTSPQIQLSAPLRYSLEEMSDVSLTENMSVDDCLDGDLTSQIRATYNDSIYIQQPGDYTVTVQVSNSAGDTCSVPLTLTVTDSSDSNERDKYYPVLSQYIVYTNVGEQVDLASLVVGLERNGSEYLFTDPDAASLPGARENVSVSGDVDYGTAGTYNVDYQFTSEAGVTATTKLAVVVR
nr:immunoglobulin-like domain-containing protein [uncultured Merdimonas sp.]